MCLTNLFFCSYHVTGLSAPPEWRCIAAKPTANIAQTKYDGSQGNNEVVTVCAK